MGALGREGQGGRGIPGRPGSRGRPSGKAKEGQQGRGGAAEALVSNSFLDLGQDFVFFETHPDSYQTGLFLGPFFHRAAPLCS